MHNPHTHTHIASDANDANDANDWPHNILFSSSASKIKWMNMRVGAIVAHMQFMQLLLTLAKQLLLFYYYYHSQAQCTSRTCCWKGIQWYFDCTRHRAVASAYTYANVWIFPSAVMSETINFLCAVTEAVSVWWCDFWQMHWKWKCFIRMF